MRAAIFALLSSGCTLCVSVDRVTVDDDGNGDAGPDAGVCPGAPDAAPALLWPWNGAHTGSLHAPRTRTPSFRWSAVQLPDGGQATYEIWVDDSCAAGGHAACAMPDPEVDIVGVASTEVALEDDLPVASAPPVGTRYAWRVRACDPCSGACGPLSVGRYLDVGREENDVDGDGYADVLIGALGTDGPLGDQGAAYLYRGGPDGVATSPSQTLRDPAVGQATTVFGRSLAIVGDVDADGFADAVIGAYAEDAPETDEGVVRVYRGGPTGLSTVPDATLDNPMDRGNSFFSIGIEDAGDVDADGFRDFAVGAYVSDAVAMDAGAYYVFRGDPAAIAPWPVFGADSPVVEESAYFGVISSAGDFDDDGYTDLLVGAPQSDAAFLDGGAMYLLRGSPDGPVLSPDPITGPTAASDHFGYAAGAGDLNGDSYGDVVVGAPLFDGDAVDEGIAYLYWGGSAGLDLASPDVIESPVEPAAGATFGQETSGALDANGDGWFDLLIGAPQTTVGPGQALLFLGDGTGAFDVAPTVIDSPSPGTDGRFATRLGSAGDVNGDGYADFVIGAYNEGGVLVGRAYVLLGGDAGLGETPPFTLTRPAPVVNDYFGLDVSAATAGL